MSIELNSPEEDVLIKRASEGDREAFGEIVKLYETLVYNTVKLKVGNAEDALDVSQEAFLKMWRYIGKYRGECRFATWVYRICVNASLDFLRHAGLTATEPMPTYTDKDGDEITLELPDESANASPENSAVRSDTVNTVRRAIARLSGEQREIIMLRDIDGYSYEEISEMLGLEIGTVKSRLNRARNNLKELLRGNL